MVPVSYTEASLLENFERLRELLNVATPLQPAAPVVARFVEANAGATGAVAVSRAPESTVRLSEFYPVAQDGTPTTPSSITSAASSPKATPAAAATATATATPTTATATTSPDGRLVRNLSLSGWNPPPPERRLRGDLVYFDLTTLENKSFVLVGTSAGFLVTHSTQFEFAPAARSKPGRFHDLYALVSALSPAFKARFPTALAEATDDGVTLARPPRTPAPWLALRRVHTYDPMRAIQAPVLKPSREITGFVAADYSGATRDWNDEYQAARELPVSSAETSLLRERAMAQIADAFVEAATRAAVAAVDGAIAPINDPEPVALQLFVVNHIFLSRACDSRRL